LQDIIHDVRVGVWAQQPAEFFRQARIDMDGCLVETSGACKQGMDIAHDGTWGYHALVLTLANTGEVLGLVNRSANRPSAEGAAAELDRALAVCFRGGFQQVLLRGDTKFSQTEQLDRWTTDRRVRFLFGYEAKPNLQALAEALPERAWQPLARPPRYTVKTQPRQRPDNVKEAVVVRREHENSKLASEQVAEFNYQPTACRHTYRMIVVRKHLSVEQGQRRLFDDVRYFFYLTNDWVSGADELVFSANDRCHQENLLAQLQGGVRAAAGAGGPPAQQLGLHGDDGLGLGPEGLVGAATAGGAGAVAKTTPSRETLVVGAGIQNVCECVYAYPVPAGADGPAAGLPAVGLEPALADLLPCGRTAALLRVAALKSASGCADPCWHRARSRRK